MKASLFSSLVLCAVGVAALPAGSAQDISTTEAFSLSLDSRAACTNGDVDRLLFSTSIDSFEKSRNSKNPDCNWSSDNCSWSPDKPDGFNFIPSCHRHDFGYRNTKAQKRFNPDMKKRIDDNFKNDLYKYCSQFSGIWSYKGVECRRIADIYVAAVRKFGKRKDGDELHVTKKSDSVLDLELDEE